MKTKLLTLGTLLGLSCLSTQAQLTITTNTVAPSLGLYDQYYLPGAVDEATQAMTPDGTDNTTSAANDVMTYVAADKTSKGQSFTTGSNPAGYVLTSITFQHILWPSFLGNGTWMSLPLDASLDFRFGTIGSTTLSPLLTTTATYGGTTLTMSGGSGTGTFFTIDMSSAGLATLSPNTTYFFELASSGGYFELNNTRGASSYAGGTAFSGDGANAVLDEDSTVTLLDGDFAFVAKLTAVGAPAVTASAAPSGGLTGQKFTVTAVVTPGTGTITNASINLSAIGGAAAAGLVLSNNNVYTNTFTIPSGAVVGTTNLTVKVMDTTPLGAVCDVALTINPSVQVWNGGSSTDSKWSRGANWASGTAPTAVGSSLIFAGSTRLTPDMDSGYSLIGLTFSNTAGAFAIGTSTGSTLTNGSAGIVDNSSSAQALSVPLALSGAQTFNITAGSLTLNSNVTASALLTKSGAGTLAFASPGTNVLGDLVVTNGLLKVTAGRVVAYATQGNTKIDLGGSVEVDTNAVLYITNGANAWFPLNDTADTTSTLTVAGGTVVIRNNWGIEAPRNGNAIININSGSMTVNDIGNIGLILGDAGSAQTGTLNLNGGTLLVSRIIANNGSSTIYFNGGTLKPTGAYATFLPTSSPITASVRNGGAIIDSTNLTVAIAQYIGHSSVDGDNATDGGLTKVGSGSLSLTGGYGYTGPNKVLAGTLILTPSLGVPSTGGDLLVSNSTLTLDATGGTALPAANVTVQAGATVNVTNNPSANAINGTGSLTLSGGTTLNLNYGDLSANPTAAAINVSGGFTASGTNIITITGSGFVAGQFPLIDYTGTTVPTNTFRLASLPAGVNAVLTNNTANASLDLLITFVGNSLNWHGASADGSTALPVWDINTSLNWYDKNMSATAYLQYNGNAYGDMVTFADNGYNTDGTNHVTLNARVVPSTMTVSGSTPYTLTGTGGLDGSMTLKMNNTASLLLGTSNNFTGGTAINAGTVLINDDSALGASSSGVTLGGGTLQIAGNATNTRSLTVTANSTLSIPAGVASQWGGSISGSGGLTKASDGALIFSGSSANTLGNLTASGGQLKLTAGTLTVYAVNGTSKIDAGASVEVDTGATLYVTNGNNAWFPLGDTVGTTNTLTVAGGTVVIRDNWGIEAPRNGTAVLNVNSGSMTVNDIGGIGLIMGDGGSSESGTINLNGGTLTLNRITASNGTNTFCFNGGTLRPAGSTTFFPSSTTLAACVRGGGAILDSAGYTATIAQPLVHSTIAGDSATDGGLTKIGNGTINLNGSNSYTGSTIINGGALGGVGVIPGALVNNSMLAPGSSGIGTLTVNGAITLSAGSTNIFEVNSTTQTRDMVVAGGNVTYGGILSITPTGTFTNGQQYVLFKGTGATNTSQFAGIAGSAGTGLTFSFTNGVLSVVAGGPSTPATLTNSVSGGALHLAWPAGQGWRLQAQTNSLSVGLSTNWVYLTDGSVSTTNISVSPSAPAVFYRLTYP
jgi:autotransporter-associated beta strand protein